MQVSIEESRPLDQGYGSGRAQRAYASASIVVREKLDVPERKFNVNGGAIALGHPIGCSGARLVTTMIHSLRRRKQHRGLVTLCLGGGEAVSIVLETI